MTEGTEIVVQESREEWLPIMTVEQAVRRYDEMQRFVKSVLKEGVDFGIVPGTGDKPTLLKPGAEKFAKFFGLGIEHDLIDSTEDWENGFFNYRYKIMARDLRTGKVIATGEGSCNSKEKKYRIRYVPEFAATEDEKKRAISRETKVSKRGNDYVMLTILNDDPYSIVNTIQKMAYKRALVAAVLVAANASDYFTQDIEDMAPEIIDAEVTEVLQAKQEKSRQIERPLQADILRSYMARKVKEVHKDGSATQEQRGLAVGMIELCFAGEEGSESKRHSVLLYLFGQESSKDLSDSQILSLLDWLEPTKDSGNAYQPSAMAVKEARLVLRQQLIDSGQGELL